MQTIVEHQVGCGKGTAKPEFCVTSRVMEVVRHVIGEVVYGGRVTDANDCRLLEVLVRQQLPWPGQQQQQQQQQRAGPGAGPTSAGAIW